ncbi:cellulose synthase [Streptosporangium sp. NPDC051023]|uniref:cellulose synthase n=1 Tax=Streptosporangium sp. NPDC051023 TaxID=3155410 RepID=UPI00344BD464
MSFDQIAWLPLCAGVTGVGLVLSFLLMRRKGAAAGLRGVAWSLLPAAAYLTGALPALWQVGTAIVGFFAGLVLNPMVWAGVAVTALSAVLFLVSGVLRRRRSSTPSAAPEPSAPSAPSAAAGPARPGVTAGPQPRTQPQRNSQPQPQPQSRPSKAAPAAKGAADDDFSDIEAILKRRGIG